MIPCRSSGSSRADSGVEPTRSQNITVSCRRSAPAGTAGVGSGRGCSACGPSAAIEADRLGQCSPGLVEFPSETERRCQQIMNIPEPRIFRARPAKKLHCLIQMAQKEMAHTQCPVDAGEVTVARAEEQCLFYVGDARLGLAEVHHDLAELAQRSHEISIERNGSLQFDLCLGQAILQSADAPHLCVGQSAVRICKGLEEQLLGARQILLNSVAPTISHTATQGGCEADLRIDRTRIDLKCAFEGGHSLLPSCNGASLQKQSSPAHDEIAGIGIDRVVPIDPPTDIRY